MTSKKININDFLDGQYHGYKKEIARHIGRSDSWISQALWRGKKWTNISGDIRKEIVQAINIEEWATYTHKDFDWSFKQ